MLPQFDIASFSSQIFWLAICLSILYFFVKYQVVKHIEALSVNRDCSLESILETSEDNKTKATKLLEDAKKLENLLKLESKKIKDDVIHKLRTEQDNKIIKISLELDKQQEQFKVNLEKEINELSNSLPNIISRLVTIISDKVENEASINKLK